MTLSVDDLPWAVQPVWRGLDIGPGWYPIVETLHNTLVQICPGYQVLQVKEKFGGLRYYTTWPADLTTEDGERFANAIRAAEGLAAVTCEQCGEPGTSRDGGWIRTLCDTCQAARG